MPAMQVPQGTKAASISGVIRRADGTVIDLGTISFYHRAAWRRWLFALRQRVRRRPREA